MNPKKRIILVEDEEDVASLVKLQAELYGYKLHVEVDGINGYRAVDREKPDIVLLDVLLPGQNGFDVCRKIKTNAETKHIPIIMLTAKTDEMDVVLGLELGADDYVGKPFSPKILFSRVKSVMRRNSEVNRIPKNLKFGEFILEVDRYILKKKDRVIPLTLSEFGILKRLLAFKGKVLTRTQLLDDVHNEDSFIIDRNIDVHIASLRKKLEGDFSFIETVRGVGYRFREKS